MSEFGKGLTYCLGLYVQHAWMWRSNKNPSNIDGGARMWFNGASDHLYELQIPKKLPGELIERLTSFQDKVLTWGHGFKSPEPTIEDVTWSINEAQSLLLEIDKFYGIDVEEADFK